MSIGMPSRPTHAIAIPECSSMSKPNWNKMFTALGAIETSPNSQHDENIEIIPQHYVHIGASFFHATCIEILSN